MPQTAVQPLSASAENPDALYSNDPYAWALPQAKALREMRLGDVDWKHLIRRSRTWRQMPSRSGSAAAARRCCTLPMPQISHLTTVGWLWHV